MADDIRRIQTDIALRQAVIFIGNYVSLQTTNDQQEISNRTDLVEYGVQNSNVAVRNDSLDGDKRNRDSLQHKKDSNKRSFLEITETSLAKHLELIHAIGELDCPILTSNYGLSLERILNRHPLTWNRYQPINSDLDDCILHIYGYLQEPESVIFTAEHYQRIHEDEIIASKMRAILEYEKPFKYGKNYMCSKCECTFQHVPCYYCDAINPSSGDDIYEQGRIIRCHSCNGTFQHLRCPHCFEGNYFPDCTYTEGNKSRCVRCKSML